jgi:SAM-dependent MidA family methyltransferase
VNPPADTPVAASLRALIRAQGPVTVSRFMAEALYHPQAGYYMRAEPFGAAGDFITAPEISQMFGEIVGLWCVDMWARLGAPAAMQLVEIGPGRGTLMADMLRATRRHAPFRPVLVEVSPRLRAMQQQALAGHDALWVERFEQVPDGPFILVANELFDALPIRQFMRLRGGWHERMVGVDANGGFVFTAAPDRTPLDLDAAEGSIAELCPAADALMQSVAARIVAQGGAALAIDYGRSGAIGDSLQALRQHRHHPVLEAPGAADLTAHVDFAALARAARAAGAAAHGPTGQGNFLLQLGIAQRAQALQARGAVGIDEALHRLVDDSQMGTLFKVLAVTPPGLEAPAGFAA